MPYSHIPESAVFQAASRARLSIPDIIHAGRDEGCIKPEPDKADYNVIFPAIAYIAFYGADDPWIKG